MKKLILAAFATALIAAQAFAFTGTVGMGSSDGLNNASLTKSGSIYTLHFGANWDVQAVSGSYTGLGELVAYTNFSFDGSGNISGGTVSPLWSYSDSGNTFTFDLASPITVNSVSNSFLQLIGTGTAFINGSDATAGTWSITGNKTGVNFHFTAASVTTAVPDGGSAVALLGLALAGIEGARRLIGSRKA